MLTVILGFLIVVNLFTLGAMFATPSEYKPLGLVGSKISDLLIILLTFPSYVGYSLIVLIAKVLRPILDYVPFKEKR